MTEPLAFCLSTVGQDGRPSARFVLLRGLDERGLVFYTNYGSRKGHDLEATPYAAATFWWADLERQVRVEGQVARVSPEESDAYFGSRPRGSQLASASSPQSGPISGRDELERRIAEWDARYPDAVPRPAHWGGYRLAPDRYEFWQGRPDRAHDRFLYERTQGTWTTIRLSP